MLKYSYYRHEGEAGKVVVPLFGHADKYFEKTASVGLMPEVATYIQGLRPRKESQYVLVNALGASEYFGSNVNGDAFPEAALVHRPSEWTNVPAHDKVLAESWPYGFPTFYGAHPYAHHKNKDSAQAFGEVELATWNPHMRRAELVTRLDYDKCQQFGGTGVWDKIQAGGFPDVSMGAKVPFDTCSICLDWDRYRAAQATFDPKRHAHPGMAVLEVHKRKPIRGVSITRKDYCEHALKMMNVILPDGRKVFVFNDYPRFFDISYVFIGADRTAKQMLLIFSGKGSWPLRTSTLETASVEGTKTASAPSTFERILTGEFGKQAGSKRGSIDKDNLPSNLAGKAVPLLTRQERDLPPDLLADLAGLPLPQSLATLTALGIVLRPKEFQHMLLMHAGAGGLADEFAEGNQVFPRCDEVQDMSLRPEGFLSTLLPLLLPFLSGRSGFGPFIEQRVLVLGKTPEPVEGVSASLHSDLMRKIGAAYNGYRAGLMELVAHAPDLLDSSRVKEPSCIKLATVPVEALFTPLSATYFHRAFLDECGRGAQVTDWQ